MPDTAQPPPKQPDFTTWRSEQGETLSEYLERMRQIRDGMDAPDSIPAAQPIGPRRDVQPIVPQPKVVGPNVMSPAIRLHHSDRVRWGFLDE